MSKGHLRQSRLKAARACQRLHHYSYNLGFRPVVESEALRFGTLVHKMLEQWWLSESSERLSAALACLATAEADPYDAAKAEALIRGYDSRWRDEGLEILGVEVPFETALRNPETGRPSNTWTLTGTIDALVRDARGRVLIVEHKTSSEDISPGSEYWRRLRMDGQVSVYYEGATSLGYEVEGCLYDVLGKPKLRPLEVNSRRSEPETPEQFRARLMEAIKEEPARYFQRGEVVRLESEMAEALTDIWQTAQQIRESERLGRYPRNPDACSKWGQTCAFFSVCTGEASLDDPTKFTNRPKEPESMEEHGAHSA
jgi:hypothetical protein